MVLGHFTKWQSNNRIFWVSNWQMANFSTTWQQLCHPVKGDNNFHAEALNYDGEGFWQSIQDFQPVIRSQVSWSYRRFNCFNSDLKVLHLNNMIIYRQDANDLKGICILVDSCQMFHHFVEYQQSWGHAGTNSLAASVVIHQSADQVSSGISLYQGYTILFLSNEQTEFYREHAS